MFDALALTHYEGLIIFIVEHFHSVGITLCCTIRLNNKRSVGKNCPGKFLIILLHNLSLSIEVFELSLFISSFISPSVKSLKFFVLKFFILFIES